MKRPGNSQPNEPSSLTRPHSNSTPGAMDSDAIFDASTGRQTTRIGADQAPHTRHSLKRPCSRGPEECPTSRQERKAANREGGASVDALAGQVAEGPDARARGEASAAGADALTWRPRLSSLSIWTISVQTWKKVAALRKGLMKVSCTVHNALLMEAIREKEWAGASCSLTDFRVNDTLDSGEPLRVFVYVPWLLKGLRLL
ncbi:hypothetical protein BC629DRAFT_968214 [Irpex lacteus]|nr:hypothetical protein BC629DRAFT_968214 [Irpex lacteus]